MLIEYMNQEPGIKRTINRVKRKEFECLTFQVLAQFCSDPHQPQNVHRMLTS